MNVKTIRDVAEFPAVVIAAFVVRNAGVLMGLAALAMFALNAG